MGGGSVKEESGRVVRAPHTHYRPQPHGLTNYGKSLNLALQWVGSKAVLSGAGVCRENLGVVCREWPVGGKIGQTQEEEGHVKRGNMHWCHQARLFPVLSMFYIQVNFSAKLFFAFRIFHKHDFMRL